MTARQTTIYFKPKKIPWGKNTQGKIDPWFTQFDLMCCQVIIESSGTTAVIRVFVLDLHRTPPRRCCGSLVKVWGINSPHLTGRPNSSIVCPSVPGTRQLFPPISPGHTAVHSKAPPNARVHSITHVRFDPPVLTAVLAANVVRNFQGHLSYQNLAPYGFAMCSPLTMRPSVTYCCGRSDLQS